MTGTGELLHRGTKVFWKVRSTCDVVLIKHNAFDLVEVVCFDPVKSREAARLYVKLSVIHDRINEKAFISKQRMAIQHKEEQPEGHGSICSGSEISVAETVNYINDRLHVQSYDPKSRVFQIELVEYLPTEEKPSESDKLIFNRPPSLIPFDIMLTSSKAHTAIHSSSAPSLTTHSKPPAKELTLEIPSGVEEPVKSHTPKTPKTPVPAIELSRLREEDVGFNDHNTTLNTMTNATTDTSDNNNNNADESANGITNTNENNNATPVHNTNSTDTTDAAAAAQASTRSGTVHTADSVEADFHIHHGRRSLNRKPFDENSTTTNHTTNTGNSTTNGANTGRGSTVTSPVVSPRVQAGTAYAKQITPRKGGHISVLQTTHNTHNSHAAEARHAKQHIHTNHSIVSHYSVGSSHLAPIPVPDQLTKITTHPTLPPHRNLTPHQEPPIPDKYKPKKKNNTIGGSIATFTNAMYSLFGSSSDVKVAVDNTHAGEVHVLNTHNAVQHVKPGTVAQYAYGSSNSLGSSASGGSGSSSIPKHMRTAV